jgi:hypothetical protein
MGIAELLDAAFSFYRRNFLLIVAIAALVQVPFALGQYLAYLGIDVSGRTNDISRVVDAINARHTAGFDATQAQTDALKSDVVALAIYYALVLVLQVFIVQPLALAATTKAVSDRYVDRPASIGGSFRAALRRLRPIIASIVLQILFVAVPFGLLLVIGVFGGTAALALVAILAVALVVFWVIAAVRWTVTAPAIVIEGVSGLGGLRRSWQLLKGAFWRTAGLRLLLTILVSIISALVTIPVSLAVSGASGNVQQLVSQATGTVAQVFVGPITLVALTLLYFDARIRREAFDIEMLAASL